MCSSNSLTVCGALYMDQCSTWSSCCCWPATPRPSSQTPVSNRSLFSFTDRDGNGRNSGEKNQKRNSWFTRLNVRCFPRYGASSWHSHRLLRPSLAVVSNEWAGESRLRTFECLSVDFVFSSTSVGSNTISHVCLSNIIMLNITIKKIIKQRKEDNGYYKNVKKQLWKFTIKYVKYILRWRAGQCLSK